MQFLSQGQIHAESKIMHKSDGKPLPNPQILFAYSHINMRNPAIWLAYG